MRASDEFEVVSEAGRYKWRETVGPQRKKKVNS